MTVKQSKQYNCHRSPGLTCILGAIPYVLFWIDQVDRTPALRFSASL